MSDLIERLKSSAKAFRENTVYDSEGDPLRLIVQADECDEAASELTALRAKLDVAEANINLKADFIEKLLNDHAAMQAKLGVAREALDGYRAAAHYIGADSWDGCPDCIDILKAARAADLDCILSNDDVARNLARLRLFMPFATIEGQSDEG